MPPTRDASSTSSKDAATWRSRRPSPGSRGTRPIAPSRGSICTIRTCRTNRPSRTRRYADRPYDGEVAWSDELVGRLDAALTRSGIRDQTLVVLTSDHGEGLGDHEEPVHGFFVYESTLRVPLIIRGPGIVPGTRIPVVARSVDLFPTVLELMGVAAPQPARALAGRSLAAVLHGRSKTVDEEPSFAESLTPRIHYGWSELRSVREGRWKYILAPRPEL